MKDKNYIKGEAGAWAFIFFMLIALVLIKIFLPLSYV
jgi:hypothetical protein